MKYCYLLFIFILGICILFFLDPFLFFMGNFYSIRLPKEAQLLDYCRFRMTFPYVLDPVSAAYRIESVAFKEWVLGTEFCISPWQPPALDVATPTNLFKKYEVSDSWSSRTINADDLLYLDKKKKISLYYKPKTQTLIISIYDNPPDYF